MAAVEGGSVDENHELLFKLVGLKNRIAKSFTESDWSDLGALTGHLDRIQSHHRLLRSMRFGDDDYEAHVMTILREVVEEDPDNYHVMLKYVDSKYPETDGENVSSQPIVGRRIVFAPTVFSIPEATVERDLLSAMMPFDASFSPVYEAIRGAAADAGMECERADNIWEHSTIVQDIFTLIFRSFIVVCDFSGKNPNVFYEAGIAYTLGKHVIPITQSPDDIPFDLKHHRFLRYLNNKEGREALRTGLAKRLKTLTGYSDDF